MPHTIIPDGFEQMLRTRDITSMIRVHDRTFRRMLSCGKFPMPDVRMGRSMRWYASTVKDWMDDHNGRRRR